MDSLRVATVFTTLDSNSEYWQVDIEEADQYKTAYTSQHGLYRFFPIPYGLKNAPSTLQRKMNVAHSKVKWQFAQVYFDDVVVFSQSAAEYTDHSTHVSVLLKDAEATLTLQKCSFATQTMDYLSPDMRPRWSKISSHTTNVTNGPKDGRNFTDLKLLLRLRNVFWRFEANASRIASQLKDKLEKDPPLNLFLNQKRSWCDEKARQRLILPLVLDVPYAEEGMTLDVDALDDQVGCVLLQEDPDKNH